MSVLFGAAWLLERRRKMIAPTGQRPFLWGYTSGIMGIFQGLALLILLMTTFLHSPNAANWHWLPPVAFGAVALLQVLCGVQVLRRDRVAFLILIIFSFNPVMWVINGIYLRSRWDELS